MSKTSRREFSPEFKSKVCVEALREQHTLEELAKKYELHPNMISTWKKEFIARSAEVFSKGSKEDSSDQEALIQALYAQVGQLTIERDFLKKIAMKPLTERRAMVEPEHPQSSIVWQCELVDVCRSGLYYQPAGESEGHLFDSIFIQKVYVTKSKTQLP